MSTKTLLWTGLVGLLALAGAAAAQAPDICPECDEDGEPDESWYSSYDTGVLGEEEGVLSDTDASVGENEHGKFSWFQYCLKAWDALGNEIVIMWEAFVSEDGADVDAKVKVNGVGVDLEDTLIGDLDDETWGNMPETGDTLPPFDPEMMPFEGEDVDECIYLEDEPEVDVAAEATTTCEVTV